MLVTRRPWHGVDVNQTKDGSRNSSFRHPMDNSIRVYHFVRFLETVHLTQRNRPICLRSQERMERAVLRPQSHPAEHGLNVTGPGYLPLSEADDASQERVLERRGKGLLLSCCQPARVALTETLKFSSIALRYLRSRSGSRWNRCTRPQRRDSANGLLPGRFGWPGRHRIGAS